MEAITILGATGSVGSSALAVIRENSQRFKIEGLSGHSNLKLLAALVAEFKPRIVALPTGQKDLFLSLLPRAGAHPLEILEGESGLIELAQNAASVRVVLAVSGRNGVKPLFAALSKGKTVLLANKEALVIGGYFIDSLLAVFGGKILPIDSEHSAIAQCLKGQQVEDIEAIYLTASGGPFYNRPQQSWSSITRAMALKHPKWTEMGAKITIDSATLMNKCLEIIEAYHLFKLPPAKIRALYHPQSTIHGLVQFKDGNILAELGPADMRLPIAYALADGQELNSSRLPLSLAGWDLNRSQTLKWAPIDKEKFPTVGYAYAVLEWGCGAPACLNGANERLALQFLAEKISFLQIFVGLAQVMEKIRYAFHTKASAPSILVNPLTVQDALAADDLGRAWADEFVASLTAPPFLD